MIKVKTTKGVSTSTPAWNERKTEVGLNILIDDRRTSNVYGASLFGGIITDCLTINMVRYAV
jgi:hypothetical protein